VPTCFRLVAAGARFICMWRRRDSRELSIHGHCLASDTRRSGEVAVSSAAISKTRFLPEGETRLALRGLCFLMVRHIVERLMRRCRSLAN